ncbi:MAG TPA: replication protein [Ruminiclostridium sp.]
MSVQKENGYTPIANEILEKIAQIKLSPTQYRIIFIIWRYTYGFNRKTHDLSLSFISKAIGCDKRQIQRELKNLEERKVVKQDITNGKSRYISFNKHYYQWVGEINIGETTIGEIDNGEIDNGETVKGPLVKQSKVTIGETDNQERHSFKDNIKDNILYPYLKEVKGYPYDNDIDAEMMKRLKDKYPKLDIESVIDDWSIAKLGKPLKAKDNPRSQINTFCTNAVKWGNHIKEVGRYDGIKL